jgi:hypothetical protein
MHRPTEPSVLNDEEIWGAMLARVTVWRTEGLSTGRAETFHTDMMCVFASCGPDPYPILCQRESLPGYREIPCAWAGTGIRRTRALSVAISCVTVRACPATVTVPVRGLEVLFAATV